jgi:hypothetical protein
MGMRNLSRSFLALLLLAAVGLGVSSPGADAETVVPVEGPWSGTTSAGLPVYFEVSGGKVVNASFFFKQGFCGGSGDVGSNEESIDANGHWFYSIEGFVGSEPYVEGTFVAPEKLEGKVIAPGREFPGCPTTIGTFVATPGAVPLAERTAVAIFDPRRRLFSARPFEIPLGQGGRRFLLERLRWKPYGGRVAVAHGYFYTHGMKRKKRPAVTVRLSGLIPWGNFRIYRNLRFDAQGAVPKGFPTSGRRVMLSAPPLPEYQPAG